MFCVAMLSSVEQPLVTESFRNTVYDTPLFSSTRLVISLVFTK